MSLVVPSIRLATPPKQNREVAVRLEGLTKRFVVRRGWWETLRHPFSTEYMLAVRSVSCEIGRGEFFGLLGPNGAGKTTLFKILATLVEPDEGVATVGEYDVVRHDAQVRRLVAPVLASERSLLWRISAWENLRLYAALQGLSRQAADRRIRELLELVELADTGDKMVGTFSSGMKQRLLVARALLPQPQVLLLDEPTRSLDPLSARRLRQFLKEEIAGTQGCTVLLATHSAEEALELCDRVGILDRGRLLAVGTADALSREVGEERYVLFTTMPDHRSLETLCSQGIVKDLRAGVPDADGWTPLTMIIPGGPDRAAAVISFLAENAVPISRFERTSLSLADLIERVVERRGGGVSDA